MIWNGVERFGSAFFLFISNLVLARLLSPNDFGCIGMLLVFISISDAIVDGGFGSALIQKKDPTQTDYSTIFYWNILLAVCLYIVLYLLSPLIAKFYKIPLLSDVLKVQGVILIINALVLIQHNILKKQIAFKTLAKINLSSIIAGTVAGIAFALLGLGVWSLVIKSLVTGFVCCAIYWLTSHWRPQWVFSWSSFKSLFKFGGFMFLNGITNTIHYNILALIIGKSFSTSTLGLYTQARKLQDLPRSMITATATSVTFTVYSELQTDLSALKNAFTKTIKGISFLTIPLMMLLIVIAYPLILFLFSSKWILSVPYFQILCIAGIAYTLLELNTNVLKAMGKSKLVLYLELCTRGLSLIFIYIAIYKGIISMLWMFAICQYISYFIISIWVKRHINYGLLNQFKDMYGYVCISVIASIATYSVSYLNIDNVVLQLLIQISLFGVIYCVFCHLSKVQDFKIIYLNIRNRLS